MTQTNLSAESEDVTNAIIELKSELERIDIWLSDEIGSKVNEFIDNWQLLCQPEQSIPAEQFVEQANLILKEIEPLQELILQKARRFATSAKNRLSVVRAIAIKEPEVEEACNEILFWWNDAQQTRMEMYLTKCFEIEQNIHQMIKLAMESSDDSNQES